MPKEKPVLESHVEDHLTKLCKQYNIYQHKNTGRNGIPDRLLIFNSTHWFFELKRPGKRPTDLQEAVARELRAHGAITLWADNSKSVDEIITALVSGDAPPRQHMYGNPKNLMR